MEQCLYEPVSRNEVVIVKSDEVKEETSWKPLLRQLVVCSTIWNAFFISGLCLGAPTVFIPQIRKEANSTEAVSPETASWLSSISLYSSMLWYFIPIVSERFGRKYPFIGVNCVTIISFIILYCSNTPKQILVAEIFQGAQFACQATISVVVIAEYSSPKYRGLFLTLKSASLNWGIWIANTLGTFFHWKTIAILGIICSTYNLMAAMYWCESPSWLASKHRYEECEKSHRWIKGYNSESEKELAALINSCKIYQEEQSKEQIKQTKYLARAYRTLFKKLFYMPLLLCISMLILYVASGKLVCNIYAIDVLKKMTSTEFAAYMSMLMLDGVTVLGMYIGCVLTKYVKRRTLLLTGASGGVAFLYILALYLYLSKLEIIKENKYVSVTLLTFFYLFISFGPIIMSTTIYGELMPLKYRTSAMFITGLCATAFGATSLKTALQVFKAFDLHGAYLFYGISTTVIIIFLFKYLPETKDKTLQEIEEYFVDVDKLRKAESVEAQPMYRK